jgi:hypothetical protein
MAFFLSGRPGGLLPLFSSHMSPPSRGRAPSIANGEAQIVIAPVEVAANSDYGIEDANEDFFA